MKMYGLSTEIIRTETSSNNTLVLTFKPNLGGEGDNFTPPCWFSLNNSKTVKKALTLPWGGKGIILPPPPPVGFPLITQKQ